MLVSVYGEDVILWCNSHVEIIGKRFPDGARSWEVLLYAVW